MTTTIRHAAGKVTAFALCPTVDLVAIGTAGPGAHGAVSVYRTRGELHGSGVAGALVMGPLQLPHAPTALAWSPVRGRFLAVAVEGSVLVVHPESARVIARHGHLAVQSTDPPTLLSSSLPESGAVVALAWPRLLIPHTTLVPHAVAHLLPEHSAGRMIGEAAEEEWTAWDRSASVLIAVSKSGAARLSLGGAPFSAEITCAALSDVASAPSVEAGTATGGGVWVTNGAAGTARRTVVLDDAVLRGHLTAEWLRAAQVDLVKWGLYEAARAARAAWSSALDDATKIFGSVWQHRDEWADSLLTGAPPRLLATAATITTSSVTAAAETLRRGFTACMRAYDTAIVPLARELAPELRPHDVMDEVDCTLRHVAGQRDTVAALLRWGLAVANAAVAASEAAPPSLPPCLEPEDFLTVLAALECGAPIASAAMPHDSQVNVAWRRLGVDANCDSRSSCTTTPSTSMTHACAVIVAPGAVALRFDPTSSSGITVAAPDGSVRAAVQLPEGRVAAAGCGVDDDGSCTAMAAAYVDAADGTTELVIYATSEQDPDDVRQFSVAKLATPAAAPAIRVAVNAQRGMLAAVAARAVHLIDLF